MSFWNPGRFFSYFVAALMLWFLCAPWAFRSQAIRNVSAMDNNSNVTFGINLASSYSTIAAHYPNGSFVTAQVDGSEKYKEVMGRLSLISSKHPAPPYKNMWDEWADAPRRLIRSNRKAMGLAASEEAEALAEQIKALVDIIETKVGIRPVDAVVSVPHLAALYQDDVMDACEYAGLAYFVLPLWWDPLVWDTATGVGGYGLGLCKTYTSYEQCIKEEQNMPHWNLLTVHYSRKALTTSLTPMYSAYGVFEPDYRHAENFSLGHDAVATTSNEQNYWTAVHRELREMFHRHMGFDEADMVIVTGDSADDAMFKVILKDAVMSRRPLVFDNDLMFAVAKGAAELRMRGKYRVMHLNDTSSANVGPNALDL